MTTKAEYKEMVKYQKIKLVRYVKSKILAAINDLDTIDNEVTKAYLKGYLKALGEVAQELIK